MVSEEEEEEEEKSQKGGPGFNPDWDKFYADQQKGQGEGEEDALLEEEEIIEEEVDPALIAQIEDISTLGLVRVQFGEGFYPPE